MTDLEKLKPSEASYLIGVSPRQLLSYRQANPPLKSHSRARGLYYKGPELVEWFVAFRAARLKTAPILIAEVPSIEESEARKEAALAQLRELELAQKRGELVSVVDTEDAHANRLMRARSKLLGLGARLAARLQNQESTSKIQLLIDAEVESALLELSKNGSEETRVA